MTPMVRPQPEKSDDKPLSSVTHSNGSERESSSKTLGRSAPAASPASRLVPQPEPKCDVHSSGAKVESASDGSESESSSKTLGRSAPASPASRLVPHPEAKCDVHSSGAKVADSKGSPDCDDSQDSSESGTDADAQGQRQQPKGQKRRFFDDGAHEAESAQDRDKWPRVDVSVPQCGQPKSKQKAKTESHSTSSAPKDSSRKRNRPVKDISVGGRESGANKRTRAESCSRDRNEKEPRFSDAILATIQKKKRSHKARAESCFRDRDEKEPRNSDKTDDMVQKKRRSRRHKKRRRQKSRSSTEAPDLGKGFRTGSWKSLDEINAWNLLGNSESKTGRHEERPKDKDWDKDSESTHRRTGPPEKDGADRQNEKHSDTVKHSTDTGSRKRRC